MAGELPPGFTLDAPAAPAGLPAGFTLDVPEPKKAPSMRHQLTEGFVDMVRPGGPGKALMEGWDRLSNKAGEAVTDALQPHVRPEIAAGAGALANAGTQAVPMFMGGQIGSVAEPAMQAGGKWMMLNALRAPLPQKLNGKAQRAAETMLEEGYNAGSSGAVKDMVSRVDALKPQASAITDASTKSGNALAIIDSLRPMAARTAQGTVRAGDLGSIGSVRREFIDHPSISWRQGGASIPVQDMQAMKEVNYQKLGDSAYGNGVKTDADKAALKTITNALRGQIESLEPSVIPLNAEISKLLNAKKIAERRVMMSGNNNIAPLGATIGAANGNLPVALGSLANTSDLVKALLSRAMYSGQIPTNAGRGAGLAYALQNQGEQQ